MVLESIDPLFFIFFLSGDFDLKWLGENYFGCEPENRGRSKNFQFIHPFLSRQAKKKSDIWHVRPKESFFFSG